MARRPGGSRLAALDTVFLPQPGSTQTTLPHCQGYMWHGGWIFARGEIDKDEYDERRKILRQS